MSVIHQWKMIIHEHCRLVSSRVLHKKRRRLWSGAVMIMSFGRLGSRVCLLVSNLELDATAQVFFCCWANFERPHMKLACHPNIDVSYVLGSLLMLAECMIAAISFLHKPEHNSCWGWSVWLGLQSNYICLVLLASVICFQSWKRGRVPDAAEAFVL